MTPTYIYASRLTRVVDADTLDLRVDLGFHVSIDARVRVRGVYAPERHTPIGAAAAKLVSRLLEHQPLVIETEKDRKGHDVQSFARWVADVYVGGRNLADVYREAGGPVGGIGV